MVFLLGLLIGLAVFWLYSKLAPLNALGDLKRNKRQLMKQALTHEGSFSELLHMQKDIIGLSLRHLRIIFIPALTACIPMIAFLAIRSELATLEFFLGMIPAYLAAKYIWKI